MQYQARGKTTGVDGYTRNLHNYVKLVVMGRTGLFLERLGKVGSADELKLPGHVQRLREWLLNVERLHNHNWTLDCQESLLLALKALSCISELLSWSIPASTANY